MITLPYRIICLPSPGEFFAIMAYFASAGAASDQAYEARQATPSAAALVMPPRNPALNQNTRPNSAMTRNSSRAQLRLMPLLVVQAPIYFSAGTDVDTAHLNAESLAHASALMLNLTQMLALWLVPIQLLLLTATLPTTSSGGAHRSFAQCDQHGSHGGPYFRQHQGPGTTPSAAPRPFIPRPTS